MIISSTGSPSLAPGGLILKVQCLVLSQQKPRKLSLHEQVVSFNTDCPGVSCFCRLISCIFNIHWCRRCFLCRFFEGNLVWWPPASLSLCVLVTVHLVILFFSSFSLDVTGCIRLGFAWSFHGCLIAIALRRLVAQFLLFWSCPFVGTPAFVLPAWIFPVHPRTSRWTQPAGP